MLCTVVQRMDIYLWTYGARFQGCVFWLTTIGAGSKFSTSITYSIVVPCCLLLKSSAFVMMYLSATSPMALIVLAAKLVVHLPLEI